MNEKGQALVEFVLILPVIILLVFSFIDVGKIILCKNNLEGLMNDVVLMVRNNNSLDDIKRVINDYSDYVIEMVINYDDPIKIVLNTNIDLITPGLDRVFDEDISIERSILYE